MSIGFSIGDLVAVGTLANNVYDALQNAAPEFQDCASLCHEVSLVIEECGPNNRNSVLRVQDSKTVAELAGSCKTTFRSLESMLRSYNSLGSTSHRVRDTLGFAYAKGRRDNIRKRLGEHFWTISAFLTGSLVSSGRDSVDEPTLELIAALFTILHKETSTPG